jgi:hypothetical protein
MAITRNEFATRVLQKLGIPERPRAVKCLVGWMVAESGDNKCTGKSGDGAKFNPLNTTKVLQNCIIDDYNSVGVKNYASVDCGIKATAATLELPNYDEVRRELRRVRIPGWKVRFSQAVGKSSWGTSEAGVMAGINASLEVSKWGIITVG